MGEKFIFFLKSYKSVTQRCKSSTLVTSISTFLLQAALTLNRNATYETMKDINQVANGDAATNRMEDVHQLAQCVQSLAISPSTPVDSAPQPAHIQPQTQRQIWLAHPRVKQLIRGWTGELFDQHLPKLIACSTVPRTHLRKMKRLHEICRRRAERDVIDVCRSQPDRDPSEMPSPFQLPEWMVGRNENLTWWMNHYLETGQGLITANFLK